MAICEDLVKIGLTVCGLVANARGKQELEVLKNKTIIIEFVLILQN
jgi:hypothetical protein